MGLALILILGFIALRNRSIRLPALWTIVSLLPFSLWPAGSDNWRYYYLPSTGSSVLVALLFGWLGEHSGRLLRVPMLRYALPFVMTAAVAGVNLAHMPCLQAVQFFFSGQYFQRIKQNHRRALDQYRNAQTLCADHPFAPRWQFNMAMCNGALGNREEATNALFRLVRENPDYDRPKEFLMNAMASAPRISFKPAESLIELGKLGDRDALNTMTLALQREFSSAQSSEYTRLGIALFDLGAVKKSNAAYEQALLLDENNTTARVNMGWGLYRTGDIPEAIAMYQAVLGRQKHVIAQFNLGLAYLAMGDLAAANATYAAAIAEFGAEEAERIGADSDLRELARNSKHAENAHELLRKYWPKKP